MIYLVYEATSGFPPGLALPEARGSCRTETHCSGRRWDGPGLLHTTGCRNHCSTMTGGRFNSASLAHYVFGSESTPGVLRPFTGDGVKGAIVLGLSRNVCGAPVTAWTADCIHYMQHTGAAPFGIRRSTWSPICTVILTSRRVFLHPFTALLKPAACEYGVL